MNCLFYNYLPVDPTLNSLCFRSKFVIIYHYRSITYWRKSRHEFCSTKTKLYMYKLLLFYHCSTVSGLLFVLNTMCSWRYYLWYRLLPWVGYLNLLIIFKTFIISEYLGLTRKLSVTGSSRHYFIIKNLSIVFAKASSDKINLLFHYIGGRIKTMILTIPNSNQIFTITREESNLFRKHRYCPIK